MIEKPAYDRLGLDYCEGRTPDPRWFEQIKETIGTARTIVNVGAGTGSYEPSDRYVLAVEPSQVMIAQRPVGSAPCLVGYGEALPIANGQFDLATAFVTLHHWTDWRAGVREMQRVAGRIAIVHFDPLEHASFWLVRDYFPELVRQWENVPSVDDVANLVRAKSVRTMPVPFDCVDGFLPAFWRRPHAYLDHEIRRRMSGLQLLDEGVLERGLRELRNDLQSGRWMERHAALMDQTELDVGWRLIAT